MKITALETLRTEEFSNVLWVRVHTDSGTIGTDGAIVHRCGIPVRIRSRGDQNKTVKG